MSDDIFDCFPEFAAVTHDTTGDIVLVKKGRTGYWPMPEHLSAHQINEGLSPKTLDAMKTLSVLGWKRDLATALMA